MKGTTAFVGVWFMAFGVAALIVSAIIAASMLNFRQTANVTDGIVEYYPQTGFSVQYKVEGREFTAPLGFKSSAIQNGDTIRVYVDAQNPNKIQAAPVIWFLLIPGGLGVLFLAIGLPFFLTAFNGNALKKRLLEDGRLITAEIEDVKINPWVRVNSRYPYNIYCKYTDPNGAVLRFKSQPIWFGRPRLPLGPQPWLIDPGEFCRINGITTIPVYIDPYDYGKYYVDTREIEGGI